MSVEYDDRVQALDPSARQSFDYANPVICNKSPPNMIVSDLDTDCYIFFTFKLVERTYKNRADLNSLCSSPKHLDAGIYPNARKKSNLWCLVSTAKGADKPVFIFTILELRRYCYTNMSSTTFPR